ncbi:putative 2OG-Fe(II) oxygenase [Sphingomonas sp. HMP6]|uniref:putative 2OG-Fe(II) oxygenase n=1 Tax=Sphingomonas sp. HMP6 TaxID=1517551 RepID=UPI0015965678|nr:putative 2OG-Fe(II) oxygenase [Sphingomonas sp. HMP6]
MIWFQDDPAPRVREVSAEQLRSLIVANPTATVLKTLLGDALMRDRDFAGAAAAFASAARDDPTRFERWTSLVRGYRKSLQLDAALDALRRADRVDPSAALTVERGRVLRLMGQVPAAEAAFRAALSDSSDSGTRWSAFDGLLRLLALDDDGARLLAACDEAQKEIGDVALVRAHRALAYSRMGKTDAARHMIDVDRHVLRLPVAAPDGYADIGAFNAALSEEILRVGASPGDVSLRYMPDLGRQPVLATLLNIIRTTLESYVAKRAERGLADVLPPPPASAKLFYGNTVLRNRGVNGVHIHGDGYVSAVYHVSVPGSITAAADHRGALALGVVGKCAPNHVPCWGIRYVRPVSGWLTLFPSHFFHDVVPSGEALPRISVAADLLPR